MKTPKIKSLRPTGTAGCSRFPANHAFVNCCEHLCCKRRCFAGPLCCLVVSVLCNSMTAPDSDSSLVYTAKNAYGDFEVTVTQVQVVLPSDSNLRGDYYCQIKCGDQVFRTESVDTSKLLRGQQIQPVGAGALALTLRFDYTCANGTQTRHVTPTRMLTFVPGTCAAPSLNSSCVITVFSVYAGSTSTMAWLQTPALSSLFDVVKAPPPKVEQEQLGKQQWTAAPQDLAQSTVRARLTRKKSNVAEASAPSSPSASAAAAVVSEAEQPQDDAAAGDAVKLPEGWRRLNDSAVTARAALTGRSGTVREGWFVSLTVEEDSVKKKMRGGGLSFTACPWHCGCMVLTGHMDQHLTWCRLAPDPSTAISCSNAAAGCSFTGLRPAVADHLRTCEYTALATVFAQFTQEKNGLKTAIARMDEELRSLAREKALLKETISTAVTAQRSGIPFVITQALECDVGQPGQTMHEFLHLRSIAHMRPDRSLRSQSSTSDGGGDDRLQATRVHGSTAAKTSMRGSAVEEALVSSNGKAFKTTSAGSHFGFESAEEARRPSVQAPEGSSASLQHWLPQKRVGKMAAHDGGVFCISVAVMGGDSSDVGTLHPAIDDDDRSSLRGQTLMFTGGGDGVVKVWNDISAVPVLQRSLQGHTLNVKCIAAMAATAFSGGQDNSVRVWDVESGACSSTLLGHSGCVMSLIAYGDICLSMAADRTLRLWDVRQQRCVQVFDTGSRGNYGMSVYKGSVVSAQSSVLFEADLRSMKSQRWQTHAAVSAVNVSAAVGTAAAGQSAAALSSAIERVNQHRKEDSGRLLPSDDYSLMHQHAQTLSAGVGPIGYYSGISSNVNGCGGQILRGDTLYAGNVDCSISIWNMPLHCDIKQAALKGHKDFVRDVQSYGAHLFSVSDDGSVKCWEPTKLLSAVRTLAPTAFQKAEEELAAEQVRGGREEKLSDGPDQGSSVLGPKPSHEEQEFNLRAERAKDAAKIALATVRWRMRMPVPHVSHAYVSQVKNGVAVFDVSSLLQRMRLHEGHSISTAALAHSLDKVHDGAFLYAALFSKCIFVTLYRYAVRQACGRLLVGGADGVVSLWS
jgi:WD40 repeat protein